MQRAPRTLRSPVRALLLVLLITATLRFFRKVNTLGSVRVPSDLVAGFAAIWIVLAGSVTDGLAIGLKSGGVLALEFTGTYYVFRHLLGPVNSSVRVVKFSCMLIIVVVGLALLDPLTQRLFTHNFVNALTGYVKEAYDLGSESIFRNGLVRAMGPLEHSILFAAVCTWFVALPEDQIEKQIGRTPDAYLLAIVERVRASLPPEDSAPETPPSGGT